ncbi:RHS repeat-associated core domain-containing protein [Streptomyces sp. NPDC060205]|uniref:RHS repeat-associated core domain-containing protein n=2 Tax=Streptomyces TaxID=1883 RepID=UPI00365A6319
MKKLKKSYDLAGDALAAYWPELERAQTLADKALVKGREAQADLSSAKSKLSSADSWVTRANKEADKYKDDPGSAGKDVPKPDEAKVRAATRDAQSAKDAHTAAQSDVTSAQSALDAAKKMAADARQMREDAAGEAKRKLDDASDAGIQNRKWYEEVGDWFVDNWDTIVAVCKVVVAVLGIIAMIIGGPILGAIVLIAALVVLADTLNKYMKGQASLWDVAFAALDCIPGMKGLTTLGGLAKGLKALGKGGLRAMAAGLGKRMRGLGRKSVRDSPTGSSRPKDSVCSNGTDPIDLATGKMYLPQTDITLPGTLPLVFRRRVESGYQAGWWFGPSWSSTVDQRLEFDDEGVVFVHDEGLLLAYPTPEPGVPVLPSHGPRWPLTRTDGTETSTYTVTDSRTGQSRHFRRQGDIAVVQSIEDRNGNTIGFEYDEQGAPTAVRHSGGYVLKTATEGGRIVSLHLAGAAPDGGDQEIRRYGYSDGDLTSVTNSSGLPLRFTYDSAGCVTSWTDTNGHSYSYEYDEQDRCIAEGSPEGHMALRIEYSAQDESTGRRITTTTTGAGHTRRFVINDANQLVAETDPLGGETRYERDQYNRLLSQTDSLGRTIEFRYDDAGNPTTVVRPDGSEAHSEYNELGLPVRVVNADGDTWQQVYDERGNRIQVTDPVGATTSYAYEENGSLVSVTDALGHSTRFRTNAAGLPVRTTDELGLTTKYERDAFGRRIAVTDPLDRTVRLDWTVEGRLARRIAPDGSHESWTYDGEGNRTSHTDRMGNVSHFEYTCFDVLSARTGPDGVRLEFGHDTELRLTRVTGPLGLTWDYTYDSAGRLIRESDFDGRVTTYLYDAADQLVARTNALGQTIRYRRDAQGRMTAKEADGAATTFSYTPAGRLVRAESSAVTLTRQCGPAGRLSSETVNGRTTEYAQDILGRRTSRVTPTGTASTWSYDMVGRRAELTTAGRTVSFDYDDAGQEIVRHVGETVTLTHAFDEVGRLTGQSVAAADGHPIQDRTYTYRADGNVVRLDDRLNGTRHFDVDTGGRVTSVRATDWTESYAYDSDGNQTHATWPETHAGHDATGPRSYAGTRITRAGGVRYEHDALGRIVLRQKRRISRKPETWHYTWDAEDRLTAVTTPDGTQWRYRYDALGRRSVKDRLAPDGMTVVESTAFVWDGSVLCEQTTTAAELPYPVTVTWEHRGLLPVTQFERITAGADRATQDEIDSRFFTIITDLVGTPSELVDESGDIAWRSRSTLWGTTTWAADSSAYTPLRFPGQYYDPETGLHYNHHRVYDPETARYLSPDPLGLTPSPNPHTYVRNPVIWTDHLGLSPDGCAPLLYRAPKTGQREAARQGLDPAAHGAQGRHEGTAYLGDSPDVAAQYAGEPGFEPGFWEYKMKPEFRDEFPASEYRQVHENSRGAEEYEWVIPEEDIPRFNELIDGEPQWFDSSHGWYERGR